MFKPGLILQDRYQLVHPLGRSATVRWTWLATDLAASLHKLVVMKFLVFTEMHWQDFKLFEREAQVLQYLNHPRIPRYQDYFQIDRLDNNPFCLWGLVQDYVPGTSLQELLEKGTRFDEQDVYRIAEQTLQILVYLHGSCPPVLHRDIKPSNLIFDRQTRQIWLIDFGAVQNQAPTIAHSFTVVGTVGYAPLEQFWGRAIAASDLYALGGTLVHLLTGVAPVDLPQHNLRLQFRDRTTANILLIKWIEKLTEPSAEQRFSSAQAAYIALKHADPKLRPTCENPQRREISSPKAIQSTKRNSNLSCPLTWYGFHGFCILAGLAMLAYGSSDYRTAASFGYKAIPGIGIITKTRAVTSTNCLSFSSCTTDTYYISTVQFKTNEGILFQFTVNDICRDNQNPYACDGKTIQVFYHSDNPEINMIQGGPTPMDGVVRWIGSGLVFILGGIGSSWFFRQKNSFWWD